MKPIVSVVIPTYNRYGVLANSIESVLAQTYKDFELIVVDDGSTDDTSDLMKKYLVDERVRYIQLEKNAGVSNARNVGVENARGEWIAFQDSDDCWRPDKLRIQMEYIAQHPNCGMVYSAFGYHMPDEEEIRKIPNGNHSGDLMSNLLICNRIGAPTIVVKKELFISLGGFDLSYPALEDWDFAIKAAATSEIGYVDEILVDAHYTEGSISRSVFNYYQARCMLIAAYKEELEKRKLFDTVVMEMFGSIDGQEPETIDVIKKMLMKALLERML